MRFALSVQGGKEPAAVPKKMEVGRSRDIIINGRELKCNEVSLTG